MPGMPFDCHGHPITLPAELDCCFTAPPSFIHFHEVIEKLEPALKQICIHVRLPYRDDFIIRNFVNFISRKSPKSGKRYWELYDDGPRKHPFAHWVLICFMAHCRRPETKAKLKRQAQAIDTKLKADRAAARKRAREFINDPHEWNWKPPPPSAPGPSAPSSPRVIIEEAKARAKKIIEEAQAEAVRIRANAQPTHSASDSGQFANEPIFLHLYPEDDTKDEA
jgi:hypothetical protein